MSFHFLFNFSCQILEEYGRDTFNPDFACNVLAKKKRTLGFWFLEFNSGIQMDRGVGKVR